MKKLIKIAVFFIFMTSLIRCNVKNEENINLSGGYWFTRNTQIIQHNTRSIQYEAILYHNTIYPVVTDFVFNSQLIIIEQLPRKDGYVTLMGFDLLKRYEAYKNYDAGSKIAPDSAGIKNKIEKDSLLFRSFIEKGATNIENENIEIAIDIATQMIAGDSKYVNLFNNKPKYWILYHPNDSLIGPLEKADYLMKRVSMGIPDSLKLQFER